MRQACLVRSSVSLIGAFLAVASLVSASVFTPVDKRDGLLGNYGIILFPAMELQDIVGPIDPLQILAHSYQLNLYTIADTIGPVSSAPLSAAMNTQNSSFWPSMSASHTFANTPDLDVLIVPGGPGVRNTNTTAIEQFIRDRYPTLKQLITICTGAGLAAKSGVLDGKRATTNKSSWRAITPYGPNVRWVSPARWIVDGNIWSSSGVNAGMDLIFAFISQMYSEADAYRISGIVEYERHTNHCWDPFGPRYNVSTVEMCDA